MGLTGSLGAGKTTFVQGIARGLGIKARINSPTFIILREYPVKSRQGLVSAFYHVDLYRLEQNLEEEVRNLGLLDLMKEGRSIIVIEWAEKIRDLLPDETRWVEFEETENGRRIIIK